MNNKYLVTVSTTIPHDGAFNDELYICLYRREVDDSELTLTVSLLAQGLTNTARLTITKLGVQTI